MKLDWKYCECGCHQYELAIGTRRWMKYCHRCEKEWAFAEGHSAKHDGVVMTAEQIEEAVRGTLLADLGAIAQAFDQRYTIIFKHDGRRSGSEFRERFDAVGQLKMFAEMLTPKMRDSPFGKAMQTLIEEMEKAEGRR